MINRVDLFIFYDDTAYTKQNWRNRNRIKAPTGLRWLTVPVGKVPMGTEIDRVRIATPAWQREHLNLLATAYGKTEYFREYESLLEQIYAKREWSSLSELNQSTTKLIAEYLGSDTEFVDSRELAATGRKDERLIDILTRVSATHYLSGGAAKAYIDEHRFRRANIGLEYMKYEYPEYAQSHGRFEHGVSILDVLFHCGPNSREYVFTDGAEVAVEPALA